ncbi:transposase, partial [Mycobacterium avium]|uniref:transposase n=1 Tax=Mycobacterium avium TaxID=1764 RepID=UPI00373FC7BC
MASRRKALSLRDHPGPITSPLRFSRPIRCRPRRHHGIVETRRASGETPIGFTPLHGAQPLTAAIGAGPHERSASRTNQRNGSRPRTLSTIAGDLELRIP